MTIGDPLVAGNSGVATTTLNITKPTGITGATYYCLAVFHTSLSSGTLTPPSSGWSLLQNPATTNHRAYVYGKYLDAGDASAVGYQWRLPTSANIGGHMLFYPGVALSDPVIVSAASVGAASTTWNAPSVDTTGVNGCRIVACYGANVGTATGFTPDQSKGHTRRALHGVSTAPARRMVSTDASLSTGGPTGTITAISAASGTPVMATVALRPAQVLQQTPAVPQNLTATSQSGGVLLDWDDTTTAGLDGYNVYRAVSPGGTRTRLNQALVSASAYVDSTGTPGTTYYYAVTAVNGEAALPESDFSNEASAEPQPIAGLNPSPTLSEQFSSAYQTGRPYTSGSYTLQGSTTGGRLLVSVLAVDKGAGPITPPLGWTLVQDYGEGPDVCGALAFKVASGTESTIVWQWGSGSNGWATRILEYPIPNPRLETSAEAASGAANVTSLRLGPTPVTTAQTFALAMITVDSNASWTGTPRAVNSWSDGFTSMGAVLNPHTSQVGLEVAKRGSVPSGTAVATSPAWTTQDQAYGIVAVFRSGGAVMGAASKPRVGAVTESGFTVGANFSGVSSARLRVSLNADLSSPVYSPVVTPDGSGVAKATITGLSPRTRYYYGWELDGTDYGSAGGSVKTLPEAGAAASYTVVAASCNRSNTLFGVGDNIESIDPAVVIHSGDINYFDTAVNDPSVYRGQYDHFLNITKVQNVVRKYPFVYLWSDHDYGTNNSDETNVGKNAVRAAYKQYWPHYQLAQPDFGIDQTPILVGRVWFILLDERSYRTPSLSTDNSSKTRWGAQQKQNFKDFCLAHRNAPKIIVGDGPWIASVNTDDHWGRYTTERAELVNFFATNNIRNLIWLAGDMHAVASDNGQNSPGGIPVFQGAPWDQSASLKGGPYQNGPFPASGTTIVQQYGRIDVIDTGGDQLSVTFRGMNLANSDLINPLTLTLVGISDPLTQTLTPSGRQSTTALKPDGQGWLVTE
jgi:hypothetical protein